MKIYLSNYIDYIGPYQLAEKLLFWKDKNWQQCHCVFLFQCLLGQLTLLLNQLVP